ncbi:MAG: AAA family ATPase, partial [Gemmatimonadota bacterium]
EIDSMPEEIDVLERRKTQLEIEREALKGEDDARSETRRQALEADLAGVREQLAGLKSTWMAEKVAIDQVREVKRGIEESTQAAEQATRSGDLQLAAEITYGKLPRERESLEKAEQELRRLQDAGGFLKEEVGAEDIAEVVAAWTGIPVARMLESERDRLTQLEDHLHERVISQEEPISAIANAVRRSRTGLQDPDRPIGSFIFLGPTGVGKTETARALAEFLFDDEDAIIRLDMSEYMERHSVSRLIGAPPGYVGYEEGGQLTEAVRRRPYSVVLFDEIEKAHTDVFNVLLQILDDGRLTDGQGRTVDFRNTVIIMTSNVGSTSIQDDSEEPWSHVERIVLEALRSRFRPEFLNRIDEILVYRPLDRDDLGHILDLQLARLSTRLAEREIELIVDEKVKSRIADEGYDPAYGARPIKRAIQRVLADPLAMAFLEGEFGDGDRIQATIGEAGDMVFQTVPSS